MAHKLLLADDSVTIQRVIELTFQDEHIQVIAVGDGQQAIARIETERPDVVLADVGMPEKDGYEVASYVKTHDHLKHIPVLLLTGAFEPVDEARAHAIGCDGVLVKPFEPQMVINRVKDLLAGRRPQALWATPPGQPPKSAAAPAARLDHSEGAAPAAEPPPASADSLDDYFDRLDAAFASLGTEAAQAAPAAPEAPMAPPAHEPVAPSAPPRPPETAFDRFEHAKPPVRDDEFSETLDRWDPSLSEETPAAPPASASAQTPNAVETWLKEPAGAVPEERPLSSLIVNPAPAKAPLAPPEPPRPVVAPPSLSEAFAALLAAEQSRGVAPPTVRPAEPVRRAGPEPPPPAPEAYAETPAAPPAQISEDLIETIVGRVVERLTATAVQEQVLQVAERLVREEIARIKSAAP